ncbi:MAG: anthranilate synthase component I family protein, partial [Actinomycetota bacterium]|nr:anthranilate synthase component I family protein [Actinomycetota bacterium]
MDVARFSDRAARDSREVLTGEAAVTALDTAGFWAVVVSFEGAVTAVRFETVTLLERRDEGAADPVPWSPLSGG